MSEPQLERSVLEAKERDELVAIAEALGARPTSRAKKADLITSILRATGIETGDAEAGGSEEPAEATPRRRPRTRRSAAAEAETGAAADAVARVETGAGQAEHAAAGETEAEALRLDLPAAAAAADTADTADTAGAGGSGETGAVTEADTTAAAATGADAPAADTTTAHTGTADTADAAAADTATPETSATGGRRAAAPARAGGERTGAAAPAPNGSSDRGNGSDQPHAGRRYERATANAGPGHGAASGNTFSGSTGSGNTGSGNTGSGNTGSGSTGSGNNASGNPGNGPADHNRADDHGGDADGGNRFDNEPGNRRSRRRRGRDRFERGERDLPGQSPEAQYNGEPIPVSGYLDLRDEGYGFLRTAGFLSGPGDVYVSISQVRRFALRRGDHVEGAARPAGGNEKYPALLRIDSVSGMTPDEARNRPRFESLTPLFPDTKLKLELPSHPANTTARIVDLLAPIGKGQRGLIVSPPKAGKTTVLKQIAHCIEANNPEVHLMVLLVDERPEEVTDMARSVKGEVIASTFDRPAEEHIQVAELAIERAKRMVEVGRDVVIILDGITRLARAYNLGAPATGRIMSGGIDTGALYPPKKFFGAARNIEEGGSLTILATALVETGSRMDEVIFEEFKGTGNMELRLDRKLAERRIYPAIDVNGSSTRHEELLFDRVQLQQVWKLRRVLNALASEGSGAAALELLLDRLKTTRTNDEFLAEVAKTATPAS